MKYIFITENYRLQEPFFNLNSLYHDHKKFFILLFIWNGDGLQHQNIVMTSKGIIFLTVTTLLYEEYEVPYVHWFASHLCR